MIFDTKTLSFIKPTNRSSGESYKRYPVWPVRFSIAKPKLTGAWPWFQRGWIEVGNDGFEKLVYQTVIGFKSLRISLGRKAK